MRFQKFSKIFIQEAKNCCIPNHAYPEGCLPGTCITNTIISHDRDRRRWSWEWPIVEVVELEFTWLLLILQSTLKNELDGFWLYLEMLIYSHLKMWILYFERKRDDGCGRGFRIKKDVLELIVIQGKSHLCQRSNNKRNWILFNVKSHSLTSKQFNQEKSPKIIFNQI